jgi:hypothetical protein
MHAKRVPDFSSARRTRSGELKDEVYRQMFRLEEHRPGAEKDLAIALLRAWMAFEPKPKDGADKLWLRRIGPICLSMIDDAFQPGDPGQPCVQ